MNQIEIVGMKIDSHPVSVPTGLSDLLTNTWVRGRKKSQVIDEYERKVITRDGQFITKLTKEVQAK